MASKYKYKYKIKTYNAPYVTRVIRRRGASAFIFSVQHYVMTSFYLYH